MPPPRPPSVPGPRPRRGPGRGREALCESKKKSQSAERSGAAAVYGASAAQRTMATDENNHKNEARDDWTGCTFRVERGPSSEGRAWGIDRRRANLGPRGTCPAPPLRAQPRRRRPSRPFAGHAEDHWINASDVARGRRLRRGKATPAKPATRASTFLARARARASSTCEASRNVRYATRASLLIATRAGATTVAPPGRCAQPRARRPALCANVLDEFVQPLFFPSSTSRRAGRPAGSTPLRVRTVFFRAVMFPLHCYPHIVLLLPRVSFPLSPALTSGGPARGSSQSNPTTCRRPNKSTSFSLFLENDTILPHTPQGPGEMFRGRGMVPARPGPSSCTSRRAAPSRRTGRRSTTGGGPRGSRSPRRPCRAARGSSSRGRRRPRRRC